MGMLEGVDEAPEGQSPGSNRGGGSQLQIVGKVGSLPVVMTAIEQLGALYGYTKQSNSFVRYGLETAESGLKYGSAMASPVYNKLERPVSALDAFAVGQLERLEQRLPVLSKPTPQLMYEAHKLYATTLRPTVDRLANVATMGANTVNDVKTYTTKRIDGVKTYTYQGVEGVKTYTTRSIDGLKQGVHGVARYGANTVHQVAESKRGKRATAITSLYLNQLLESNAGVIVSQRFEHFVDGTNTRVDYYYPELPEPQQQPEVQQVQAEPACLDAAAGGGGDAVDSISTWSKARAVSKKATRRMYSHGAAKIQNVIARSSDAVRQLSFTVDLMEYAKTHLDSGKTALQDGLVRSRNKVWSVWEQVKQTEEVAAAGVENTDSSNPSKPVGKKGLESRLIATARQLTARVKRTLDSLPSASQYMPQTFRTSLSTARAKVDELYVSFSEIKSLSDVPSATLTQARSLLANVQSLTASMLGYSASFLPAFLKRSRSNPNLSIEMEEVLEGDKAVETPEKPAEDPTTAISETMAETETPGAETPGAPESPPNPDEASTPIQVPENEDNP